MAGTASSVLRLVARNRQLRRVELAFAAFSSGEWATWVAALVYAYAQGGVTESGVVGAVLLVPAVVLAPVLAAVGARFAPGQALALGYVAQAAMCAAAAGALLADAPRLVVYLFLVGPTVAFTLTRPTQSAFAPGLARRPEELTATNVVSVWIESASMLAAPALAGVVLAVGSPGAVYALAAAASSVGALLVAPLRKAVPAPVRDAGPVAADGSPLAGSIAFVWRDPHARILVLLLGAQCAAIGALDVLVVELAQGVLHRGADWAGYLAAAFGAGGVLALAVTARLVGLPRLAFPLALSLGVWSVAIIGLAAVPGVLGAVALLGVAGGARATFDVTGRTLLQRVARPDLLARVFGLLEGLQMAGFAVGSLLAPALVSIGGVGVAFVGVGAVLPLVALAAGGRLLEIDRHATVPVVEVALLRAMPLFAALPPPTLESLARALEPGTVSAGVDVIREGDEGDRFYVIADGEVDVLRDGQLVTTLHRGAAVGEIALMYDVPRTATVTSRRETRLYSLERDLFLAVLTGHPRAFATARELADGRLDVLAGIEAPIAPGA